MGVERPNRKSHVMTSSKFSKKGTFCGTKIPLIRGSEAGAWLACNLGFAREKGLEPKSKKISKIVEVWRRGQQTSLVQTYHRRGSGGHHWAISWDFFWGKKISILMPFGSHFAHF